MKALNTIQVLAKIGRIISKIIFVCSIVGFCLCIVGIISLAIGGDAFKLGDVTIHGFIENSEGISLHGMFAVLSIGVVFCAAEAVLCKFAEIYFKNELEDGTPFTLRGSKELLRLGILTVAVSVGTVIVCSIGISIAAAFFPDVKDISTGNFSSAGLGVMMIVLSLFCRHGAELTEQNGENAE